MENGSSQPNRKLYTVLGPVLKKAGIKMGILTKERVSPSSKRMLLELLDKHGKYEDCFFSLNTFRVKL